MKLQKLTIKEEHISLHNNSIYFSSRLRKDRGFKEDDRFQFLYDKSSKIVVVLRTKEGGVRLNKDGYCKTRINGLMKYGRYYFSDMKDNGIIFKYKKI